MERFITFVSGRIISVILLFLFNVLIVRFMSPKEYGLFAVLIALASIANTLGSLGAQRFLPKYVSLARQAENAATIRTMLVKFFSFRFFIVLVSACLCLVVSRLWLDNDIRVEASVFLPFVILCVVSSIYADAEVASQSLNQQRVSRFVSISEPLIRTAIVCLIIGLRHPLTGSELIIIMTCTQGVAWFFLAGNALSALRRKIASIPQSANSPSRHEVLGIVASGYVSGLTALGASPPFIRLIAANLLSASEFAALSFVQTITLSLQRYSPGFLLFPFVEPAIMGWQTADKTERYVKAGAALSLIAKIDAFIITFGILALCPIGGDVLQLLAGDKIDPRALILLLSMAAIIGGTVVRGSEVAASFVAAYKSIFLSSGLSFVFVSILIFGGPYMGLAAVLAFPIVDSLSRSFVMERAAKQHGFGTVIDWSRIVLCFGLITAGVYLSETYFAQSSFALAENLAFSVTLVVAGVFCFAMVKPLTAPESALIAAYVKSPRVRRALKFVTRR
jgi:O-antigen/teichoic acid export membrane protein